MAGPHLPRVLVLEDEWLIAAQIEAALNAGGYEVIGPVGHIDEALALLNLQAPDAAVLDINVHGERSFRVAERLCEIATPFVFLSGYAENELPEPMAQRPLVRKPLAGQALCRSIDALLPPRT